MAGLSSGEKNGKNTGIPFCIAAKGAAEIRKQPMNKLVWFTNNLRVQDNRCLYEALRKGPTHALYCFDPRHYETDRFGFKKTERYRAKFLLETVADLAEQLSSLNIPFQVSQGKPEVVIPKIIADQNIDTIYHQREWTSEEVHVQEAVRQAVPPAVAMLSYYDQFLFHPNDIPFKKAKEIPEVFTVFRKACEKKTQLRPPLTITRQAGKFEPATINLPDLNQMGLDAFERDSRSAFPFFGGTSQALKRMDSYFWKTRQLRFYKKTRNGLVGESYSSKFSPWLANGSISARQIYWEVKRFEKEVVKNQDTYWLIFELIWRDYFKYVALKHGSRIFQLGGIRKHSYTWEQDPARRQQWIDGETPEPFVNANMKELAATGWMSNRGRQNVASYWSKEWCQDWRVGAAYFESMLLDYDVHSNWGNWMYNSGVGNDPRDRKFNIRSQADRYDPSGKFQRLWNQETLF